MDNVNEENNYQLISSTEEIQNNFEFDELSGEELVRDDSSGSLSQLPYSFSNNTSKVSQSKLKSQKIRK